MTQRGVSESLSLAILMPLILLALLGSIQAGIWLHGRSVVHSAATVAAEQASWLKPGDARSSALDVAHRGGIQDARVTIVSRDEQVTATVTGRAALIIDIGQSWITVTVTRPRERTTVP